MSLKRALLGAVFATAAIATAGCGGGGGGAGGGPGPIAPLPPSPPAPSPPPPPPPPPGASVFETPEYFGGGTETAPRTGLPLINASSAYAAGATGVGITVAVIDTGIQFGHPEFGTRISPDSTDVAGSRGAGDSDGHGTGVAGVIAAARDGVRSHGVAFESTVLAIRADTPGSCEDDGGENCTFTDANTAAAIDYARENGARVINISLGRDAELGDTATLTFDAMRRAANAGVLMVISAGNQDDEQPGPDPSPGFPASFANDPGARGFAVAVGSVSDDGTISAFSNRAGDTADFYLVAPGEEILSPFKNSDTGDVQYALFSGTSFSAPHVAGGLALLLEAFPNLTGDEALSILFDTAVDLGTPGVDEVYGVGLIDLAAAFQPVGESSVAVAGQAVSLSALSLPPAGAAGDWIQASGLFDRAILRDGYERAFRFDLAPSEAPSAGLSAMEGAAERALRPVASMRAGPASVSLRAAEDRPHPLTHLPDLDAEEGADIAFAFETGRISLRGGRGFSSPGPVDAAGASVLSHAAFSGAVSGLTSKRAWAAGSIAFGEIEVSLRASGDGADGFSAVSVARDLGAHRLAFETGRGAEDDRALGGFVATRFEARERTETRFAALSWSGPVAAGWRGAARIERASADLALPSGVTLADDVAASAWTLGAERDLGPGVFGLTLSQPLRVEDGALSVAVPVGVDAKTDETRFERRTAALTPSGREIGLEAAYRFHAGPAAAEIAARYAVDPGHVAGAPDEAVIWFGASTRW